MTGEMYADEVTKENFPLHFAIAKALRGKVMPFDQYQEPYIVIGRDIRVGPQPYAVAPRGYGIKRLWICSDDGESYYVYNEANERKSDEFLLGCGFDKALAVQAAKQVI